MFPAAIGSSIVVPSSVSEARKHSLLFDIAGDPGQRGDGRLQPTLTRHLTLICNRFANSEMTSRSATALMLVSFVAMAFECTGSPRSARHSDPLIVSPPLIVSQIGSRGDSSWYAIDHVQGENAQAATTHALATQRRAYYDSSSSIRFSSSSTAPSTRTTVAGEVSLGPSLPF